MFWTWFDSKKGIFLERSGTNKFQFVLTQTWLSAIMVVHTRLNKGLHLRLNENHGGVALLECVIETEESGSTPLLK